MIHRRYVGIGLVNRERKRGRKIAYTDNSDYLKLVIYLSIKRA
jgi:hypothetical protein